MQEHAHNLSHLLCLSPLLMLLQPSAGLMFTIRLPPAASTNVQWLDCLYTSLAKPGADGLKL